jgi:hypothetical protein
MTKAIVSQVGADARMLTRHAALLPATQHTRLDESGCEAVRTMGL